MLTFTRYLAAGLFVTAVAALYFASTDPDSATAFYRQWQATDDAGRVAALCTITRQWLLWSGCAALLGFAFSLAFTRSAGTVRVATMAAVSNPAPHTHGNMHANDPR